ncbi:hypothetical protein CBLAS_0472 [Campylobacter blaseri]|uniref:ComEC/Rec2-related protein domain-containing protein n=1 Tax=Campylobacter blaseri TaxID=2042961 RepID=A0A2P8R0G7_9BACT|nr:hypothetical protein CQ405_05365 [Campylobacter blaseri]PSM53778.1 hypothetical protein CRN67_05365 [Campylobacter blaseri]QKF85668.1 hypothetical protein CBLAS_0472 [Campylobacter blaseri]
MKNIIKNISFCIFVFFFSKIIFSIFINDFSFFILPCMLYYGYLYIYFYQNKLAILKLIKIYFF